MGTSSRAAAGALLAVSLAFGDGALALGLSRAPAGAPNIVVVLLDDVGFGAAGSFGGPIPTPALDRLAREGLRYNRFHTTAICSPTRAALLTGRNPHAVGVGAVLNSASPQPGYEGVLRPSAATVAEILRQNGYATALFGKWHLTPDWESSPAGPFDRWPTRQGFDRFYGFLGGETDQYEPTLFEGTAPVARPARADYHLSEDLADQAIGWMREQHAIRPERPFFVYLAPGATHAPLQVPAPWIERFAGRFDAGWDALRGEILARQKGMGVVPPDTQLAPRPAALPAWEALSAEEQRVAARLMETWAGFLAHVDAQVGRVVDALDALGVRENTLFVYIAGDNGASGEGGLLGAMSYMGRIQGIDEGGALRAQRLGEIGGPTTYPHFPAGFAFALDTPFPWMKQVASHLGGTRNGMVVSWPVRIRERGGLRSQFAHVNDIAPTLLEAAGVRAPAAVNGVPQQPIDGTSLVYSFADAEAPGRHRTQYFEVNGNRAIYRDGWLASAFHGRPPWVLLLPEGQRAFSQDVWELYDLERDFSQSRDLAAERPEKLRELQALFEVEAARNGVLPLQESGQRGGLPSLHGARAHFRYGSGTGMPEPAAPALVSRSHAIRAEIELPAAGAQGALLALGGSSAGFALYLDAQGRPAYSYNLFQVERTTLVAAAPLAPGKALVELDFDYDGGGAGRGADLTLRANGEIVASGRLARSAPVFFTIDERLDVGHDSGSPAGPYPATYRFTGAIRQLALELR